MPDVIFAPDGSMLPNDPSNAAAVESMLQRIESRRMAQEQSPVAAPPYGDPMATPSERAAAGQAIDPLEAEALRYQRLHDLGYKYQGGRAERPAGWVDVKREGAIEANNRVAQRLSIDGVVMSAD